MVHVMKSLIAGFAIFGMSQATFANVTSSSANGFAMAHKAEVQASPDAIWAALTHPERWWNKEHSWSGDSANFSMTPVPGGCFCEKLPNVGFVEHARIINVEPNKLLRLSGALGPLQSEAVAATLTFSIRPGQNGANIVELEYVVGGYSRASLPGLAPLVDQVLGEQHRRLVKFLTNGKPD